MSLISASLLPHPPLLIPAIGKENAAKLEKTRKSFLELEFNLYQAQIDTLIIISPHGQVEADFFSFNLCPEFNLKFEDFGDFATKGKAWGDIAFATELEENLAKKTSVKIISECNLDHGSAVPLFFLAPRLKNVKVLPIYYSGLDLEAHYQFGKLLQQEFLKTNRRIAVIASGDLSHALTEQAPAGYSPKGPKFDQKIMELLKNKNTKEILGLNPELIEGAHECGLKSLVILLGILDGMNYQPATLSYESPFGVGYLAVNFAL